MSEESKTPLELGRITVNHLRSLIETETYFHTKKTTVCLLHLKNGFEVIGFSGVVDIKKFEKGVGEKYAFENAFGKLWELEGYLLQSKLQDNK